MAVTRLRVFLALGFGQCALSIRLKGIQVPYILPPFCVNFPQLLARSSKLFLEFLDVHRLKYHAHAT
jgi:hypothetical protein